MKKIVMLSLASVLALSTVACQSTADKVCNKAYDCAVGVCKDDACKKAAETELNACIDNVKKEIETKGGKLEETYDCIADSAECKNGVFKMDDKMAECLLKVADK